MPEFGGEEGPEPHAMVFAAGAIVLDHALDDFGIVEAVIFDLGVGEEIIDDGS